MASLIGTLAGIGSLVETAQDANARPRGPAGPVRS
jgi:hypothetical protein